MDCCSGRCYCCCSAVATALLCLCCCCCCLLQLPPSPSCRSFAFSPAPLFSAFLLLLLLLAATPQSLRWRVLCRATLLQRPALIATPFASNFLDSWDRIPDLLCLLGCRVAEIACVLVGVLNPRGVQPPIARALRGWTRAQPRTGHSTQHHKPLSAPISTVSAGLMAGQQDKTAGKSLLTQGLSETRSCDPAAKVHPKGSQSAPKGHPKCAQTAAKVRQKCTQTVQSAPKVHQKCTRSVPKRRPKCTQSAPKVHPKCTQSAPKVCTNGAQSAPKMHPKCTKSAPEVHPKCTQSAPKGLP